MKIMALVDLLILLCLLTGPRCAMGETGRFSCDFGTNMNETFCGMVQVLGNDFDWKLTSTSGKADTGPSKDHTSNTAGKGRFIWADSAEGAPGEKASISTPSFNLTDRERCLAFWYHLYGDGRLEISVCQEGDPVLTLEGDQRNEWHEQNITVSCGDNATQVTFTSTLSSSRSDVGVDDVYLYDLPPTTAVITEASVTTRVSAETDELTPESFDFTTLTVSTTTAGVSLTSVSPLPGKGSNPALPISVSVVAVFFIAALIMVVCFIQKRRQHTEKPKAQASVYKYDNHAYNTGVEEVRGNTTDTRGNTNSTFSSSTWRSDVSTMNGTGTNGTLGESQRPNRSSHTSSGSESRVPGDDEEPASRHYFVLNPERASMLVENGQGQEVTNGYDPVALYDNKPERYTYIDNENSSIAMEAGDTRGQGLDASGYDPVTIKDDITGGYQFIDDTGTPVTDGTTNKPDLQSPYEPVAVGDKPSKLKKAKASERKAPIPAARKNIPPQPKERMIDNVLYKPMNGEQMVDNVLYKPIQEDK